jgi:hypothetical protein
MAVTVKDGVFWDANANVIDPEREIMGCYKLD